jgi:hypothetical protein
MAAPTGVNEGLPQEPEAEPADVGVAEVRLAEVRLAEVQPAEAEPIQPAEGEPGTVPGGELAEAGPAEAEPAEAEHAEAEHAEAAPAEEEAAEAGYEESEPAEADWDAEVKRRDIRPLAVVGIIVGIIALVGVAVGVLAVVTHGFRPKTVITYRPAAVFGLRPGQCINSGANALTVTVLSCGRPHDAEVFATFSLPATAWPGDSAVQLDASSGCASRFDSYLNPQLATADLTQEYVYPNQAAWRADERTVVCEVRGTSGQLTGSVRAQA